jgi:hypothetical protein
MNSRCGAFAAVSCVALLVVSGAIAGKPDKPPKPEKPDETAKEWIAFSGDLVGGQEVEGCCPNAGPAPGYTLTLPYGLGVKGDPTYCPPGRYDGHIFMNFWGAGRDQQYLVRFRGVNEAMDSISIEITGGVIEKDRKNKVLTVTFENDNCWELLDDCPRAPCGDLIAVVNFTLVRQEL